MTDVSVNYLAIILAGVINMAVGFAWYSPKLFGTKWMKGIGMTPEKMEAGKKDMGKKMQLMFLSALVMAYVLANFIGWLGATDAMAGLKVGVWAWFGFLATTLIGGVLWEGNSKDAYFINAGYWLVTLALMGALLGAWQ